MIKPLKNKTMYYEKDDIASEINWKLKLGDEIFKKSDVKNAVKWFYNELGKHLGEEVSIKTIKNLMKEAFSDSLMKKSPKVQEKRFTFEEVDKIMTNFIGQ
ncbi:MAG: hypothetical protein WC471_00020 [Candidatus Woesearchaeota archaeon]